MTDYDIEKHIALRRVTDIAASPCGSWLAVSVQRLDRDGFKYVSDIWKVPTNGSAAVQLTRGDCKDAAPCFRPDGSLAYLSNRQPNEIKPDEEAEKRSQVWVLNMEGGEPRQITDEPLGVHGFRIAKTAGRLVLFASVIPGVEHDRQRETAAKRAKDGPSGRRFTAQPVRHWDHWLHENPDLAYTHVIACDADGGNRADLTPDARREFAIEPAIDISADGAWLAVTRDAPGKDRELDRTVLLIHLESKTSRVFGEADNVNFDAPVISPDGRYIATTRATRNPEKVLRPLATIIDIASGAMREIAAQWDRWPNTGCWSSDGTQLIVTADDEGHTPVFAIDPANGTVKRITSVAAGGVHSNLVVLADGRIAGIRSTLLSAPECFVVESRPDSAPHTLTRLSGFTDAIDWAEVESLRVPSTDGTSIHSFLVRPKHAATNGTDRPPLLVWIHGGPIGMDQDGWHWRWNPLSVKRDDARARGIFRRLDGRGIRHDGHDFFPQRLLLLEEPDRVVVALRHFLPVEPDHRRDLLDDARLGDDKKPLSVRAVHRARDVARDLDMLLLIATDGHDV